MHRQDVGQREQVIQDGENRFLHLAGIARPADEHQLPAEMQGDDDIGARAVPLRIRLEAGRIDDRELRLMRGLRIDNEQVANEQAVPREFGDNADGEPIFGIGAGKHILDEQVAPLQRAHEVAVQSVEVRFLHRPVHLAPVDVGLARRFPDDKLVIRRPSRVQAGTADQWSLRGDDTFMTADDLFVERGGGEIPTDAIRHNPQGLQTAAVLDLSTHAALLKYGAPVTYAEFEHPNARFPVESNFDPGGLAQGLAPALRPFGRLSGSSRPPTPSLAPLDFARRGALSLPDGGPCSAPASAEASARQKRSFNHVTG